MWKSFPVACRFLFIFTLLLGVVYPAILTGLGQILFPYEANGSLIKFNNQIVGSYFLKQNFKNLPYFHSRPHLHDPSLTASHLDPYLSIEDAYTQSNDIASKRNIIKEQLQQLIDYHKQFRWLKIIGNEKVNIWDLNNHLHIFYNQNNK